MPPLYIHIVIARDAAARCKRDKLQLYRGNYLLGSTIPDVHVISRSLSRQATHFFDLGNNHDTGSINSFLVSHPELGRNTGLSAVNSATVAGYLSHLMTDELWISDIYRPFFGQDSELANDPRANLLDRALQYALEEKLRADQIAREDILQLLHNPLPVEDILGFIDAEDLRRWQGFVYALAERQFKWENFNSWVQRAVVPREKLEAEKVKHFISILPEMREMAFKKVTWQRLEAFKEQAVSKSLALVEGYFN